MTKAVLTEIPPLSEKDCFYVVERYKTECTFPIHCHKEYELNFIEKGDGLVRIVGDSMEKTSDYDLILITGQQLEHSWEQGEHKGSMMREITIQFDASLFPENLLEKNQFLSIQRMFRQAEQGLCFPIETIMKVYAQIDAVAKEKDSFSLFLMLVKLLHDISQCPNARVLASSSFAQSTQSAQSTESRRISKVKEYVNEHFAEEIRLQDVAELIGMTPVAFSRFFHQRTGKSFSEYFIDQRLGFAARALVDTTKTISEICYESGFNNLSNFNRLFKKKKDLTPKEFRAYYKKNKYVI